MRFPGFLPTLLLMTAVALGFVLTFTLPPSEVLSLELYNRAVTDYGQYYELLSAVFVTPYLSDVLFNEASLVVIYSFFRGEAGWREVPCFLLGGAVGNLATVLLLPPDTISSGASGGVIGLLGYYLARDALIREGSLKGLAVAAAFLGFVITFSSLLFSNVNNVAHVFGGLSGMLCGILDYSFYKRHNG